MCPWGEKFGPFCSIVHLHGEKNCALRGKSTEFGMVIVLTLPNKIGYGPRRISAGGENFVLRVVG